MLPAEVVRMLAFLLAGCEDPPKLSPARHVRPDCDAVWHRDADGDGHGDPEATKPGCEPPAGFVAAGADCDDGDAAVHPDAAEVCNGIDDDCDGAADGGDAVDAPTWHVDADDDGWGDAGATLVACTPGDPTYASRAGDCRDEDPTVHPDATEGCEDGIDDDCDGLVDEDCPVCTWVVPDAAATVQAGLDLAQDGETVCLRAGTYVEHVDFGGKAVTLTGLGDIDATVLDGGDVGPVVRFVSGEGPDTVLQALTVTNGTAEEGGCVLIEGASPTLSRVRIAGCRATGNRLGGGGVLVRDAGPRFEGVEIASNTATEGYGGGVQVLGGAAVFVDSIVTGNGGAAGGGGIHASQANLVLEDTELTWNRAAEGGGGGLSAALGSIRLSGGRIVGNEAGSVGGGGAYLQVVPGVIDGVEVSDNEIASGFGGGLHLSGCDELTLTGLPITSNYSGSGGGGVYLSFSDATLARLSVTENSSDGVGGGVAILHAAPTLTDVTVSGNHVRSGMGGGLFGQTASPVITRLVARANTVDSGLGGGLSFYSDSSPVLTQVVVEGNTVASGNGGGMSFYGGGSPRIEKALIAGNTVTAFEPAGGGGLFVYSDVRLTVANAVIVGNSVNAPTAWGGGVFAYADAAVTLSHVVVVGNDLLGGRALGGGVAARAVDSPLRIDHSIVSHSVAGAGIYADEAPDLLLSYSDVWGNAAGEYEGLADQTGERGNLSIDPVFLDTAPAAVSEWDVHLAADSALVHAGDAASFDVDGSVTDLGAYGGSGGATWDLDGDGWPLWWFPGAWDPAWAALGWDCDDRDAAVFPGSGC